MGDLAAGPFLAWENSVLRIQCFFFSGLCWERKEIVHETGDSLGREQKGKEDTALQAA